MKKLIAIALLIFSTLFLWADVIPKNYIKPSWQLPEIYSKVNISYLKGNYELKFEEVTGEEKDGYKHVLRSKSDFIQSFCDYIALRNSTRSLFHYDTPNSYFDAKIAGYLDYRMVDEDGYFFGGWGMDIKANIKNSILLETNWWKGHYLGDTVLAKSDYLVDSWYKSNDGKNDVSNIDNITASLTHYTENSLLTIGRGRYLIGNNISGSIILNNSSDDYGYYSMRFNAGDFAYSIMQGSMVPVLVDTLYYPDKRMVDKYVALHQLEWRYKGLNLFLGEEIVYGNRSYDPNYMIPLGFWRISEHLQWDRDNVLIFAGGSLKLKNTTLYGNLILDELSKSKLFSNWWGNKWAVQGGISQQFVDFIGTTPRITVEVTVVRPWLYTHKYYWNYFSHAEKTLGYELGTNLINYALELNLPLKEIGSLDINCAYTRQGSYANDYTWDYGELIPVADSDDFETKLLAGKIVDTVRLESVFSFELLEHHFLKLSLINEFNLDADTKTTSSISYMTKF